MKKFVLAIITIGTILIANWGIAALFYNHFIDWSFLTGLAVTICIGFFNSSGGFMSDLTDSKLQSSNYGHWTATEVRTKIDRQKRSFRTSISFYVALSYTLIAGLLSLIYYNV
ncbi:hypothetical protein [Oceanobacillus chungangensis]|uniref:DUF3899 domain-containing protein n=1 Tax=Oceanobacillus chungangensis TaxID=1229152 RepID=A0A3D8PPX7_9BACI|nr:hypothetical protein [Oceanobacillus chungangensis]RDW17308.1 hypothetical protein CWR45_13025 [Oceanobacillus chungangensis]